MCLNMKQRLDYISILRVGAMMSVVVYHCLCGYSNIWGGQVVVANN